MAAWCVAGGIALSLIGLLHDRNYASSAEVDSVEAGRGIDAEAAMQKDITTAGRGKMLGFAGLLALGLCCAVSAPRPWRVRRDAVTLLTVLGLGWSLASIMWSVDRQETARELIRLFGYAAVAAALSLRFEPRTVCVVLAVALAGSAAVAVGVEFATGGFRPWLPEYRLSGSLHPNVLAVQAVVAGLIAFGFALDRPGSSRWWSVVALLALAVILLTKSRTALITAAAGVAAFHLPQRPARDILLGLCSVASLAALVTLGAAVFGIGNHHEFHDMIALGRADDLGGLTGRIPLWDFLWRDSAGHRLAGHGYGAYWQPERTEAIGEELLWYPRHAHSAYLEVILNLGFVGLFLLLACAALLVRQAAQCATRTGLVEFRILGALFAAAFVNGIAEAVFVSPRDMGLFAAAAAFSLIVIHPGVKDAWARSAKPNADDQRFPHFGVRQTE